MRWAQIRFPLPRPDWNWPADPVRPGSSPQSASSPCLAAPIPSPLVGSLLCGIVCANHLRLWHDSILILRESIPVCKLKIKQKRLLWGHWESLLFWVWRIHFLTWGTPVFLLPSKACVKTRIFYIRKRCRLNCTMKSGLTAGCELWTLPPDERAGALNPPRFSSRHLKSKPSNFCFLATGAGGV